MSIIPAIVLLGALMLAVIFEFVHAYVDRAYSTPCDKEIWAVFYWMLIIVGVACCRLIPTSPPDVGKWAPLIVVMLLHIGLCATGDFGRRRRDPGARPSRASPRPDARHPSAQSPPNHPPHASRKTFHSIGGNPP